MKDEDKTKEQFIEDLVKQGLLESIGDGISIQDTNFKILYQNQIHKNIIGDHTGKFCYSAYEHREKVCDGCPLAISFQDGKVHRGERSTDDGKINVEIISSLLRDSSGKVIAGVEAVRDITKRKQAEKALQNVRVELAMQVKDLETFSYSISHDLKAPLRAISGYSSILKEDYSGSLDEEGNRILSVINENAVQMSELIEDILIYSRMSRKPLERGEIQIKKLVEGVILELKGEYKDRDIDFKVKEMPNCKGDSVMIKQVLMNLISNAIKFTGNNRKAEIEGGSRQVENETVYYVKDNGVGFDMKYADKLFGLFQRLHSTKEFEGTGVGLAIVQRLIHKHRGKIWAEAKPNEGATFNFKL